LGFAEDPFPPFEPFPFWGLVSPAALGSAEVALFLGMLFLDLPCSARTKIDFASLFSGLKFWNLPQSNKLSQPK
jgi:hypothetical protein